MKHNISRKIAILLLIFLLFLIFVGIPVASIIGIVSSASSLIEWYVASSFPPPLELLPLVKYLAGYAITVNLMAFYVYLTFYISKTAEFENKVEASFLTAILLTSTIRFIYYPTTLASYNKFQILLEQALIFLPFIALVSLVRSVILAENTVLNQLEEIIETFAEGIEEERMEEIVSKTPVLSSFKPVWQNSKTVLESIAITPLIGLSTFLIERYILIQIPDILFWIIGTVIFILFLLSTRW